MSAAPRPDKMLCFHRKSSFLFCHSALQLSLRTMNTMLTLHSGQVHELCRDTRTPVGALNFQYVNRQAYRWMLQHPYPVECEELPGMPDFESRVVLYLPAITSGLNFTIHSSLTHRQQPVTVTKQRSFKGSAAELWKTRGKHPEGVCLVLVIRRVRLVDAAVDSEGQITAGRVELGKVAYITWRDGDAVVRPCGLWLSVCCFGNLS